MSMLKQSTQYMNEQYLKIKCNYLYSMQQQVSQEHWIGNEPLSEDQRSEIIRLIKQTYSGKSTRQVKQSQQKILKLLENNLKAIQLLFEFIKPPYQADRNFRNACGNLIKKTYYRISETDNDKRPILKLGYQVLVATNYCDHRIKQNIGVGFQYIFNKDEARLYKNDCMSHAKTQFQSLIDHPEGWTLQTIEVLHGLMLVFISYLNSEVEPEDQAEFVNSMLSTFCKAASLCAQFSRENIMQSVEPRLFFLASTQIFQFISLATQRLLQQKQLIEDQVQQFQQSDSLTNVIIQYLYLYCEQKSIITKYPSLNQIKVSILQTIYLFNHHECDINPTIIQMIFLHFLSESAIIRDDDDDDSIEKITCKAISILQNEMSNKKHMTFFLNHKIQTLFALLSYCRTTPQQQQSMVEEPQKFVEMAEEFTQSFASSPYIKIRASNFIRTFVTRIDEGLSNLVELCVIFITGSLAVSEQDSQTLRSAKQAYSNFEFMNLSKQQKLDISFMVLSILAQSLVKRQDLKIIITSVLMTNFNTICKITDQLIILRLIRLIGYYPNALYFPYIENCMGYSRTFTLEGLTTFDRISRNKQYLQIFPLIHMAYQKIEQYINVGDPIFERLINQNYERILKKNNSLYQKMLIKIYNAFEQATNNMEMHGSKQKSIICLNYIEKMIRLEKSDKHLAVLEQIEQQMETVGMHNQILQENFISIYETLISKQMIVNQKIQQFVLAFSDPQKLHHYPNYSEYFKLLNKFIVKSDCFQVIQMIFNNLINYLAETGKNEFNYAIVPQLIHCIGNMFLSYSDLIPNPKFIDFLVQLCLKQENPKTQLNRNQQWYIFLMLHFMFRKPAQLRIHLLTNNKYYAFMLCLFKTKFSTKIQRKTSVLAAQQILVYQPDEKSRIQIIRFCLTQLKIQAQKYMHRRKNKKGEAKEQKNLELMEEGHQEVYKRERKLSQQERMENEAEEVNDKDAFLFKQFKHPLDKNCEFGMFKQRILTLIGESTNLISEQTLPGITEIMQLEWYKNEVRKVFKISK